MSRWNRTIDVGYHFLFLFMQKQRKRTWAATKRARTEASKSAAKTYNELIAKRQQVRSFSRRAFCLFVGLVFCSRVCFLLKYWASVVGHVVPSSSFLC